MPHWEQSLRASQLGEDECVTSARDGDSDGFGSAACAASPGDDCDDENPDTHPHASEVCDGIDNDCNAQLDLADGLALGGTTRLLMEGDYADVAWSTTGATFGIVYGLAGRSSHSGILSNDGSVFTAADPLKPPDSKSYGTPVIAWSSSAAKYAVAFAGYNAATLHVATLDGAGTLGTLYQTVANGNYELAARPSGAEWVLAVSNGSSPIQLYRFRETSGLSVGPSLAVPSSVSLARVTTSGDDTALVYTRSGGVDWARISGAFDTWNSEPLCVGCRGADVEGFDGGYALSWFTPQGVNFVRKDRQGITLCGPTVVPIAGEQDGEVSLAAGSKHVLALAAGANGAVAVLRFSEDCRLLGQGDLTDPEAWPVSYGSRLAVGGGRVALTWTAGLNTRTRVMTELLCQ